MDELNRRAVYLGPSLEYCNFISKLIQLHYLDTVQFNSIPFDGGKLPKIGQRNPTIQFTSRNWNEIQFNDCIEMWRTRHASDDDIFVINPSTA